MKSNIEWYVIEKVVLKRKQLGISQNDIAEVLGVSKGFIGKVESIKTKSHYNLNHINLLSQFFKCSPKNFLPNKFMKS
ncbi:MAG: helix-turn-helix transcriptional regulator [Bacteroidetes bacterium]|nr:helix-turn-helix transcriptional regulator [Bacteroidota bacterium]